MWVTALRCRKQMDSTHPSVFFFYLRWAYPVVNVIMESLISENFLDYQNVIIVVKKSAAVSSINNIRRGNLKKVKKPKHHERH